MPHARNDNYGRRRDKILKMRARLRLLYFLQFAVWGCYLTSLGQFLGNCGLGQYIAWFYAAIGVVSLFAPSLFGYLADRHFRPVRLLAFCHAAAGMTMLMAFAYAVANPALKFEFFYPLYLLFLSFYMPTMALANTVSFGILRHRGLSPVDSFPAIRVWGTVGFVAAMWWVNSTYFSPDGGLGWTLTETDPHAMQRFQYNAGQLACTSVMGLITALYTLSLPVLSPAVALRARLSDSFRGIFTSAKKLFTLPQMRLFLIFVAFTGVCLQISNGFVTPFITHFMGIEEFAGALAAGNASLLFSLSQISEAAMILLVGVSLRKLTIRYVFAIGIAAWCLRFLFLALGNPGDGLWMLILSMIIYGVAFNFITIAGHLYVDSRSPEGFKGFGQGAMMLMSNGIGATVGTLLAGDIINRWCHWELIPTAGGTPVRLFMGDWTTPWLIFAAYAALVAAAWLIASRIQKKH